MSRVGKKLIPIPKDVKVRVDTTGVQVQGPKGKLTTPAAARHHASRWRNGQLLGQRDERRAPAARLPRPGARARQQRHDRA